jgi:hypothetical protein
LLLVVADDIILTEQVEIAGLQSVGGLPILPKTFFVAGA